MIGDRGQARVGRADDAGVSDDVGDRRADEENEQELPRHEERGAQREQRRARDHGARLVSVIGAFTAGAAKGLEDHDRWILARRALERKLVDRRSTSKLPALIDYVMARPIVSAGMVAKELSVTPRAAQDLVAELGLREATGKRRYRAWGIL